MAVYGNDSRNIDYLGNDPVNPDYLRNVPLGEMIYTVIEQSEADFNKIMMEAGVRELAYVEETHTEMIYEAGKIKEMVDSVTKWFKELWERIKAMIDRALNTMAQKSAEFRKKVLNSLNKDFLRKRLENVDNTKDFGTTYEYNDLSGNNTMIINAIGNADNAIKAAADTAHEQAKNGNLDSEKFDTVCRSAMKEAMNAVLKNSTANYTISTTKKLIMNFLRGDQKAVNGAIVKYKFNDWIDEVANFPKTKRELKTAYSDGKKSINEAIKKIKSYDTGKLFEPTIFTKVAKYMKQLRQILVCAQQSVVSCANERESFYRSVIFKVIGTKPVKESTDYYSESSTSDAIGSLFNW